MTNLPKRKRLPHAMPCWVKGSEPWFITVCCAERGRNSLAKPDAHACVSETLRTRQALGQLRVLAYVLMPDHLHLIARFDQKTGMVKIISSLKRFVSRETGVEWQRGFFDHRIRTDMQLREIEAYVRMNPVRAGLAGSPDEWPYAGPR